MKRIAIPLFTASLLASLAGSAWAEARGAAGISQVGFTLIDLTPDDGIAPTIQFNGSDGRPLVLGQLRAATPNENAFREFMRSGATPLSDVAAAGSTSMSGAHASVVGAGGPGFSSMSVEGYALSGIDASGNFRSFAQSPLAMFTLGAHTAVRFWVDGWASGSTTIGKDASGVFDEWGGGMINLEVSGYDANGEFLVDRAQQYAAGSWTTDALGHISGTSDWWTGNLSVLYSNTADATLDGSFGAQLSASGHSVSAVPEPAEYGMLLVGFGLIGAISRRRARPRKTSPRLARAALPALGLALCTATGLAQAGASSTVKVSNVVITLTDLDVNDGVTPWIAPMFASQPYLNGGAGTFTADDSRDAYSLLGRNDTSVLNGAAQTAYANSAASIHGASTIVGFDSIDLSGNASSGRGAFGTYGALGSSYTPMNFLISANTAVTISFSGMINVNTSMGFDPASGTSEQASGNIGFSISGYNDAGQQQISEQYMELMANYLTDANGQFHGESKSWSGDLSLTFNNLAAHEITATFNGEAGLGGHSVSAVPEPAAYGMLLAGLGLIGSVARRRKQA